MKSTAWFALLSLALMLPASVAGRGTPTILEPRADRHEGPPLWISAEAVAHSEKIIDVDLIDSDTLRKRLEKQQKALGERSSSEMPKRGEKPLVVSIPPSECPSSSFSEDGRGGSGSTATLADLARNSSTIVRGRIRTVDLGFAFGTPSSLLGVDVSRVLKGQAPVSPFYIDYPVARFKIGPFHFCNTNQGFEPHPGDEVLLFDYTGPADRDAILYVPRFDQLFFQSGAGSLILPPQIRNTPELTTAGDLDDVADRLSSKLDLPGELR